MRLKPLVTSMGDAYALHATLLLAAETGFCASGAAATPAAPSATLREASLHLLSTLIAALARDDEDIDALVPVLRAGPAAVAEWVRSGGLNDNATRVLDAWLATADAWHWCKHQATAIHEVLCDPYLTYLVASNMTGRIHGRSGRETAP